VAPLAGASSWSGVIAAGGLATAGGIGVVGVRDARRTMLLGSLRQALAPVIGNEARLQARRWRGWPGTPRLVVISYSPLAKDGEVGWTHAVTEALERRLEVTAQVHRHDRRKRRLVITTSAGKTTRPEAELRAQRTITDLLGAAAKITGHDLGAEGELARFTVRPIPTTKVASSGGYRAKIERTFSAVHQGRWRCRWDLQRDQVTFELRPSFPPVIELPRAAVDPGKDPLRAYDKVEIRFGRDEDGHELVWRPAIDPNLMVVGAPGTGKTVLEHSVLVSVAQFGWPVWILDGKAIEFLGFRAWPNVQVVASRVEEQVALITRAHEVMEHRYQLIVNGRASEDDFEPLMLFIDEWSDFRANLLAWYTTAKGKGMPVKPAVLERVASIARKGRSARVHLLFATQRPDAEYFGGDMRDNFRMRISMGRLSAQGAMMMWMDPNTGTTVPRNVRGRATTINDDNRPVEVQTFFVPDPRRARRRQDPEALAQLEALQPDPQLHRHDRLLIVEPTSDEIDQAPSTYHAWAAARWVRATDRPDLDPLTTLETDEQQARALASPMAMFGIPLPTPISTSRGDVEGEVDDTPRGARGEVLEGESVGEEFPDFLPAIDAEPLELSIGDMVELEPGSWVVLDEEPEEDPMVPGGVLLCWRDDDDQRGVTTIGLGETITARTTRYDQETTQ